MYVCMHINLCMVFAKNWRFKAPIESKVVPYDIATGIVHCIGMNRHVVGMW